ncbi:hypothetical protein C8Q74DRAFT_1316111 [Fomes fomentarius]|nr:hypothetical protein C8Q74DRAFT_1316111 [Fomes fomentarius]
MAQLRGGCTRLPPELWLEIFRYATHVPRTRSIAPGDPFAPERPVDFARAMNSPTQSMRTKCILVQVCRAWGAVATEVLYEHVVLGSARRVEMFCRTLRESRREASEAMDVGSGTVLEAVEGLGYGRWVRHLEVQRWGRSNSTQCYWQCMVCTISFCPRLRVFSGLWQQPLPDGFLAVLARYLPPTLQELYWQQDSVLIVTKELSIMTTPVLARFPALRTLDLRKICVLDAERSLPHFTYDSLSFPHVQYLALPTCPLVLRYASQQTMPALNHLTLDASGSPRTVYGPLATKELTNFLHMHGQQLRTVELLPSNTQSLRPGPINVSAFLSPNACPNLETLTPIPPILNLEYYSAGSPSLPVLEEPHPTLRRIGIRGMSISKLYPNKPTQAQAHLEALVAYRAFFPALEVVRTLGFLVATSSDQYAPDVFVWWTERFESVGVDLQDGEGVRGFGGTTIQGGCASGCRAVVNEGKGMSLDNGIYTEVSNAG